MERRSSQRDHEESVEAEWLAIIRDSERRVQTYLRIAARDDSIAREELYAEVVAQAWIARQSVLDVPDHGEALVSIARDACRKWMEARRRDTALAALAFEFPSIQSDPSTRNTAGASLSIDEAVAWQHWADRVLHQLSYNQRVAIDFRYRWGWTAEITGEAMGISPATVRVHAWRGLRRLKAIVRCDPPPTPDLRIDDEPADASRAGLLESP